MRKPYLIGLLMACVLALTACGGGGGGSSSSGGGGSSSGGGGGSTTVVNSVPLIVDSGPPAVGGTINEPFVTVTICSPSSPSTCQTIDHILVDTGSSGLRIISSVLSSSLALPQQTDSSGNAIAECASFADGYAWGTIKTANLQIGTESVNGLTVHIIGDPNYPAVPDSCSATGPISENTVASFGANGVIGVSVFAQDCGPGCAQSVQPGWYYSCSASSCQEIAASVSAQVQNPVSLFRTDNNGVILSLPAVPSAVASSVTGTLTFGIGTQSNNALGSAQVYTVDPNSGNYTTTFNGVTYTDAFVDSGSNGIFFTDNAITLCNDGSGFYCPSSVVNLSAVTTGLNGTTSAVNFSVGNVQTFASTYPGYAVFSQVGGNFTSDPEGFDWGLPFFYGRNVYTAIQGASTPAGYGPYVAY